MTTCNLLFLRCKELYSPKNVYDHMLHTIYCSLQHIWPAFCYSINLLVSVSSWHLRSPATVSLLTYDSPYLHLCHRSMDRTAFFSHMSHVCIVYKTDIDWVVPQSIRQYYYGFPFTREGSRCTLSCFLERRPPLL